MKTISKNKEVKIIIAVIISLMAITLFMCLFLSGGKTGNYVAYQPTSTPSPTVIPQKTSTDLPYKEPTISDVKKAILKDGYAYIPELQIRIKADESISDLIYVVATFYGPEFQNYKTTYATFSTQTLLNKGGEYCTPQNGPVGSIGRSIDNPTGKASGPMPGNVTKIGEYFYHFLGPQASCSLNKETQSLETTQRKLLEKAFHSLEVTE